MAPSRTHVMFPILATMIQSALVKLQRRLDPALFNLNDGGEEVLSGCTTAFNVLKSIINKVFSSPNNGKSSRDTSIDRSFELKHASLPQISPWLRSYARKATGPLSTEPLTSPFLSFLIQVPQSTSTSPFRFSINDSRVRSKGLMGHQMEIPHN